MSLAEELAHEGLVVFEDESITLNRASYEKESKNLALQCVSVKGKHLV
jgi:hypothetical protein